MLRSSSTTTTVDSVIPPIIVARPAAGEVGSGVGQLRFPLMGTVLDRIVAAHRAEELKRFHTLARELGMAALVEVHDEEELKKALPVLPDMIGVNQRDLRTFEVDRTRAVRLARTIPAGMLKVAESGIET